MIFDKVEESLTRFYCDILSNECPYFYSKRKACKACDLYEICLKTVNLLQTIRDYQKKRAENNPFEFVEQLTLEE